MLSNLHLQIFIQAYFTEYSLRTLQYNTLKRQISQGHRNLRLCANGLKRKSEFSFDLPKFKDASVFVHFHSFSCVANFTSSITSGTQPPNTNIRFPITVAECKLLGKGGNPLITGFVHVIVSEKNQEKNLLGELVKRLGIEGRHQTTWCRPSIPSRYKSSPLKMRI